MNWLRRLPGSHREAPGLEWKIWRQLPKVLILGTVLPVAAWFALAPYVADTQAGHPNLVGDYVLFGALISFWLALLTVGFGCMIVMIMKGHAYVADGFEVSHSDQPDPKNDLRA